MEPSINLSELLAAMEEARSVHSTAAFTCRELREMTNFSEGRCVDLIRAGIGAGKLRAVRKCVTDMAGRAQTVPAYEPVERGHVSR